MKKKVIKIKERDRAYIDSLWDEYSNNSNAMHHFSRVIKSSQHDFWNEITKRYPKITGKEIWKYDSKDGILTRE